MPVPDPVKTDLVVKSGLVLRSLERFLDQLPGPGGMHEHGKRVPSGACTRW